MGQLGTSTDLKEDVWSDIVCPAGPRIKCLRVGWIQEIQGKESPPERRSSCSAETKRTKLWLWIHLSLGSKAHLGCLRATLGV